MARFGTITETAPAAEVWARLVQVAQPQKRPDPIQWIEAHRNLSPESSRTRGPFLFSRAPYLIEPQREMLKPEGGEVVVMCASQVGKTELLLNCLLFWSELDPAPAMVLCPDWKAAQSFSVERVRPMLRDADRPIARGRRAKTANTMTHMMIGALPLTISHSSGAAALAMRPIRYLVMDEVSRYPLSARGRRGDEGDPVALAKVRTTSYGETAKVVYVSSPIESGSCRITELFEESTRERWHCRCAHCGSLQILKLSEMDFETATAQCLNCGIESDQDDWQREVGEWIAENAGHARRGFWLNCFASPFIRWPVVFEEWREAVHAKEAGDFQMFRVVLQTRLAENFSVSLTMLGEPEMLAARREDYGAEVPDAARVIVAAVDTMDSWLEYLIAAIGERNEIWLLDTGTIEGRMDSDAETLYSQLEHVCLARRYKRADGRQMAVVRAFQDSGGHATAIVYAECKKRSQILTAWKGSGEMLGPWRRGTDTATHSRLILGNPSYYKDQIARRFEIEPPGPGSIHFGPEARGFDDEFFQQLLSERKETRRRRGVNVSRWEKVRERNEALDLLVMILCCVDTFRGSIDRMSQPLIVTKRTTANPTDLKKPTYGVVNQGVESTPQLGSVPEPKPLSKWGAQNRPLEW